MHIHMDLDASQVRTNTEIKGLDVKTIRDLFENERQNARELKRMGHLVVTADAVDITAGCKAWHIELSDDSVVETFLHPGAVN